MQRDNRFCLICNPKNRTLYWHKDSKTGDIWCYCNKCQRGYSLKQYCALADVSIVGFLAGDFQFEEARPNEVQAITWPSSFIPLSDPRAEKGARYISEVRKLNLDGDMYYDLEDEGIVFPYYFNSTFCGAQVRFLETRKTEDDKDWKITTLPGTRLGLLFYGWNQTPFMSHVKGVVVCEGAFNALSINQALNVKYGGIVNNPWRAIACSGSGTTDYQKEVLKELKDIAGMKVIVAPDTDDAGFKMLKKFKDAECANFTAFTNDTEKDWNEKLKELGHEEFANFFISSIRPI